MKILFSRTKKMLLILMSIAFFLGLLFDTTGSSGIFVESRDHHDVSKKKLGNSVVAITGFVEHEPIKITSDVDFAFQAALNGWKGNGTRSNPYIIEGLSISASEVGQDAIHVENTTAHFILQNNTLTTVDGHGIYLHNVSNAVLINNSALSCEWGGFYIDGSSHDILLQRNIANDNNWGFFVGGASTNITLKSNVAHGNYESGFHVGKGTVRITLTDNVASFTTISGFVIVNSNDNTLINNTASSNYQHGFVLINSTNNVMLYNEAIGNIFTGFLLEKSKNNTLINNTALQNSGNGFALISDGNNTSLINNTASGNDGNGFHLETLSNVMLINNSAISNHGNGFTLLVINQTGMYWNVALNNWMIGIYVSNATNTDLMGNLVAENSGCCGIHFEAATKNKILNNTIFNHVNEGFFLDLSSGFNEIKYNNFIFNDLAEKNISQRSQAVTINITNFFDRNYWEDHVSPDGNGDGIVDVPYFINGMTVINDSNPLVTPYPTTLDIHPSILTMAASPSVVSDKISSSYFVTWIFISTNPLYYRVFLDENSLVAANVKKPLDDDVRIEVEINDLDPGEHVIKIFVRDPFGKQLVSSTVISVEFTETSKQVDSISSSSTLPPLSPFVIKVSGGSVISYLLGMSIIAIVRRISLNLRKFMKIIQNEF